MDQTQNDSAVEGFKVKLRKHFVGISPAIIQAIIAAISAILGGCVAPTPASLRSQIKRPVIQIKLWNQIFIRGVPIGKVGSAQDAATNSVIESTDDELATLVAANDE
jgi:hypothetical protein